MKYRSRFPRDLFADLDRWQSDMQQAFNLTPTIRGLSRGAFPALNVGSTAGSVEIYAFVPGVDPSTLDVQVDRGVLTIAGERKLPEVSEQASVHIDERFEGRFRRVISLPDDVDPAAVQAQCRDGVLHVSVGRRAEAQPRRITVQ